MMEPTPGGGVGAGASASGVSIGAAGSVGALISDCPQPARTKTTRMRKRNEVIEQERRSAVAAPNFPPHHEFAVTLASSARFCDRFACVENKGASRMTQNTNPWAKQIDPLAQDIAAVLRSMGGSAHQRDVVQCIAAMKRQRGETVAQDLAHKIVEAFERYRDLFFRPFGEGSMRWALQPGVA
jgi:hypothetical protein